MVKFNILLVIALFLFLNTVMDCWSARRGCPTIQVNKGRVRIRQSGQSARITCYPHYKLVRGNEIINCVRGEWDSEYPICAQAGCPIIERIPHGILNVVYGGAKLEVTCDLGYSIDGPSFVYCNDNFEWNDELRGCKENNEIYLSCDFESSDDRLCGWKNDMYNDVDWLADKMSFLLFSSRRHVPSGSSQYFSSNYISLDAGNYGSSTSGRLLSPPLLPSKTKQRCLIFSYKVTSGSSYGPHILKVSYGGIPHWATSKGEGKVIIGLFKLNVTSNVIIEGRSCKVAIDNLVIADGDVCSQQPYEEETDSCHDNCGKITNGNGCSCDWDCYNNNDCCSELKMQCPYIKPLEDIAKLYLTTTPTMYTTKPSTIKSSTLNVSVFSPKIFNESKTADDQIIETTPLNDHDVTMINTTINNVTQPIPTSNITYPTFPPTPPLTSTIKPITITITIASTLTSTEFPKLNYTLSNSPLVINDSSTASTHKKLMTVSDITAVANITKTTAIPKIVVKPGTTTKLELASTNASTPVVTNSSSSTAKPDIVHTTILYSKLINASDINVKLVSTNKANVTTSITSSTIKPVTMNVIPITKTSTNFSNITQKLLIKSNTSKNFEPFNNTFNFPSKVPDVQKIKQNIVTTENKSIIIIDHIPTRTPHVVDNLNHSAVSNNKMIVVNTFHPNSDLITSKYITTSENGKIHSDANNFSNVTSGSSEQKSNTFVKTVKQTKMEITSEKPDLNDASYNQSAIDGSKYLTEFKKQNGNAKSSGILGTIVSTFKYIAVMAVILITFKFTFSFVRWYFTKPTRDEMNTCFIESDKESDYNIELVSNT